MEKIEIKQLLQNLAPISLQGLDKVKLLNRVDRKYIIPITNLPGIINLLNQNHYSILEINDCRAFSYLTTYYDTADYRFYKDHHNRLGSRIKVRTRTYKESNLHFFEVKMKSNLRTDKYREKLGRPSTDLSALLNKKIHSLYPKSLDSDLTPTLFNSYTRLTLVNKAQTERCTIDINLSFRDPLCADKEIEVNDIAIIEVKQSKTSVLHGIIASLRTMRIHPSSISKYVYGLILTHPEIKHNSFKPLINRINRIAS